MPPVRRRKAASKEAAKSVIHIFMPGGIAHQETWDPKPNAPIDYRGEMGSIDTKLSGVRFNELLKQTAQIADKITVCRSMTHGEAAHERGTQNMFTGYRPSPALVYPSFGSVVSHEFGPRENLPPYVCIPNLSAPDAGSGYLSSSYGPFTLGADPANQNFSVRDLNLPGGVDETRFASRRNLLEIVNQHFSSLEKSDKLTAMDTFYDRAYSLISSQKAREAFNIKAEPDALRNEYGRNAAGQRMLLARRLVESGVRFVTLTYGGWDHHAQVKNGMQPATAGIRSGFCGIDSRFGSPRTARFHARDGIVRIRPHAQSEPRCWARSLAESVQHRAGRWRHQERERVREQRSHGGRAGYRPAPAARPLGHALPLPGH